MRYKFCQLQLRLVIKKNVAVQKDRMMKEQNKNNS